MGGEYYRAGEERQAKVKDGGTQTHIGFAYDFTYWRKTARICAMLEGLPT
jgi:hypothetical protein